MLYDTIVWIEEKYIKQHSGVMENVDMKFLKNNILKAQNINVQGCIGGYLYDTIMDEYEANYHSGTTITEKYKSLVDTFIKPVVLYNTLYHSMFSLYGKITNKGIQKQSSDYSEPISEKMLFTWRTNYKDEAEWYEERLTNYLRDNDDIYIKWRDDDPDRDYEIQPEKGSNYRFGLYLGGKEKCYSRRNLRKL